MKLRPFNLKRLSGRLLFHGGGLASDPLARWKAGGIAGKKITFWGDSTTELAGAMWDLLNTELQIPLGPLVGVTTINKGSNGQTMAGANDQMTADVYATNPDLIVLCFGINDVRRGGVDAVELAARITTAVNGIQANLPNCDIVLWTPNSILSPDGTGVYVEPIDAGQAYSDIMWNAYNSLKGKWPHVASVDKMEAFGRVSLPTNPMMDDTLHPNKVGQFAAVAGLLPFLVPPTPPIDLVASAAAFAANPAAPWLVYPRAIEDTRHFTRLRDIRVGFYGDISGTVLMYWGATGLDSNPDLHPADFALHDLIYTSAGVYEIGNMGDLADYNVNSVQFYGPPTSSFPNFGGTPARLIQYRRVS